MAPHASPLESHRTYRIPSCTKQARDLVLLKEDVHPALLAYLDSGMRCLCGKPVWSNVTVALVPMVLARVSNEITGGLDSVCIEAQLCSNKCLQNFMNNPYAF